MKTKQIGNIKLTIAEGLNDISASREKDIQQLYYLLLESNKTPQQLISECIEDFNKASYVNLAQKMANYLTYLKVTDKTNVWGSIYCLISFMENEQKETLQDNHVQEKLSKLEKEGLTFNMIKKEVENFMKAYPSITKVYKIVHG